MSKWNDLVAKMANGGELPSSMLALPGLDARADGATVSVTLTAQDLDDLLYAVQVYDHAEGEYEWVDDRTARLAALASHLRTIRAALP